MQVKERGGDGEERKVSRFFLVSFLEMLKPKIRFHGLFLLPNQTETLVTQAIKLPFKNCTSKEHVLPFLNPYSDVNEQFCEGTANSHVLLDGPPIARLEIFDKKVE